jgi:hypothetical protein
VGPFEQKEVIVMQKPNEWTPLLMLSEVKERERERLRADNETMRKQLAGYKADEVAKEKLKTMAAKAGLRT